MERYVTITQKQREAFNVIYQHNNKIPIVKVLEYKTHNINTITLNCLIKKELIEVINYKGDDYYYRTERGRNVGCCNNNIDIDTTSVDYLEIVSSYKRK